MASDLDFSRDEISRTLPDDVDFERDHLRIVTELTDEGKSFEADAQLGGLTVCIFNGAASKCLGDSYIWNRGTHIRKLATIFVVSGQVNADDLASADMDGKVALKREILTVSTNSDVLIVIVDQDQYGSSLIDQLLDSEVLKTVFRRASSVFVFHSEPSSKFLRSSSHSSTLYYVKSSAFAPKDLQPQTLFKPLPMPNLIEHFSAAVLSQCDFHDIPCLMVVNYVEFGDSGSHIPFIKFIQSYPALRDRVVFPKDFSLRRQANSSILYNSNLFT